MRTVLFSALVLASVMTTASAADDKPSPTQIDPTSKLSAFVIPGAKVKAADADAPLADGWPQGTEPGKVEVKHYPAYRSAVARGAKGGYNADTGLFYPLFFHITRNDIAMTTPVVSTYEASIVKEPKGKGEMSMEFVYKSTDLGQTGRGFGAVKVEDHPASDFVCLGVQGDIEADRMKLAVEVLEKWLADHKNEWQQAGPIRRLGYHAPMTRRDERLWEVQIPIKRTPKPEESASK